MSRHVWQTVRFKPSTMELGWEAYTYARGHTEGPLAALTFAGYYLETARQKGGGSNDRPNSIPRVWRNSNNLRRYANGTNAPLYAEAGYRCLVQCAIRIATPVSVAMDSLWLAVYNGDSTPHALHDYLLERGQHELATIWATVLEASILDPLPKPYEPVSKSTFDKVFQANLQHLLK